MNANATLATRADSIVMVNAEVKRGEKVLSAYMIVSIRFNCWLLVFWLARLGCSLSALLLSIVTNGGSLPHHVMHALYAHKTKVSTFFLNFFFVGCGRVGVDAWVWTRGCGRVGVGVWVWGCGSVGGGGGMGMGGRGMGRAGLGLSLSDGRESPPWAYPTRIRIAGSGVIDRPTFRLPGSQMRAWNFIQTHPALPTRWQECL